ncbi:MAG TPA: hypothetical protein VEY95_00350 [Azospirillaceae bacterium]|nr:hypothetical protein [Azospirillaceae bacterium]
MQQKELPALGSPADQIEWLAVVLPTTSHGVNIWVGLAIIAFLLVAYATRVRSCGWLNVDKGEMISALFGGATFGTGTLLFLTLFHPPLLKLMGDQTLWIAISGGAGVIASFGGLIKKAPAD